jgi:chromosome segregation protein
MYLQRIELQGFKSFAQKTALEFPAPGKGCKTTPGAKADGGQQLERGVCGVTAIVGPNGSGKSNVVDAVRWVLGEQSLKLLRGKKSTDVIFSGSAKKSQMGLAEVSLYLNNEDKLAPIDYTEIVITRKLYRDGESEYLLNKTPVRLFDIVMLLAKANFGQNTYSIIGQGMVDRIVNYSPQERKNFFDEATGVKQFQIKRDRSVNKLKRSREDLFSAQALMTELEPHLKSLTRQVNRLRQRKEIETELRQAQVNYFGKQWVDLDVSYKDFIISSTAQDKQRIRLDNEITTLQEKLESLSEESGRSEEFDRLQKEYNVLTEQKNEILKDLAVIRGKLDLEYSKAGKSNLSWLETRQDELTKRITEINQEIEKNKSNMATRRQDLTDLENEINKVNDELTVSQNNLQIIQEELYKTKGGDKNNFFFESIKSVLRQKDRIGGIYGTVADIGQINSKYETALATAAGNRVWAIVVESDDVAVKCINYLKENRLSSLTFFPLNKLREQAIREYNGQSEGVIGRAIDLVSYGEKFFKVFQQLFGDTLVVGSAEDARALGIGERRMVTLDGDIFERTGIIRGGYKRKGFATWATLASGRFASQEERIKEFARLKSDIENKNIVRENLLMKINDLRVELRLLDDKQSSVKIELSAIEREKIKIENDIKESQLAPEDRSKFLDDLSVDRISKEKELKDIEVSSSELRQSIDQFNSAEEEKKKQVFDIGQNMHKLQQELNEVVNTLNGVKIELAKVETRKEDLYSLMKQDLGEEYRPNAQTEFSDDINLGELESKISKYKKQLELIGGTDPEVEAEHTEVKDRFDFLTTQSGDLEKAIKDLEKVVVELDKMIKSQFEGEFKKINKDFSRFFKKLFDGGSSKLVLVQKEKTEAQIAREEMQNTDTEVNDAENLEDKMEEKVVHIEDKSFLANMGIDIEACPPGKKIKNINVLSGGEKTMTSLALVCAIISNNPSPFIIFDEVDAALDEENSSKFGGILAELSHKTQFVAITHNRAIMARADVLYGVTMQGDGISRLLSLKLEQAQEMVRE